VEHSIHPFNIINEFWLVLGEMAPYLLFGFLLAGLLHVFIPTELIFRHLGSRGLISSLKAAIFGVPIPLCSCGVIPVAASLRKNGASKEATTAFLISTPQTGVDSILVTLSLLGPIFAIVRPVVAFVSGTFGGWLVGMFSRDDNPYQNNNHNCNDSCCEIHAPTGKKHSKLGVALSYGFITLPRDIGKALLIGLLIAAGISTFISNDFFLNLPVKGIAMMFVMMVVGIPVYVCATASVPVAAMLIAKGISPGAALVFLMTGPATNAATISVIWNTMGRRTTILYLLAVALTALVSGVLLDSIYTARGVTVAPFMPWMLPSWFNATCSIFLLVVLVYSRINLPRRKASMHDHQPESMVNLKVRNMTCAHCADKVRQTIIQATGVESVDVNLASSIVTINGDDFDVDSLAKELSKLGYPAERIAQ
jgi:hypothetical protein